jgi:hypothetical protein
VIIGKDGWYPDLGEPVVVEYEGVWACWPGGTSNIDVFPTEVGAKRSAAGTNPLEGNYAIATIGTDGDEFDPEDPKSYVLGELRTWVRDEYGVYSENGWL